MDLAVFACQFQILVCNQIFGLKWGTGRNTKFCGIQNCFTMENRGGMSVGCLWVSFSKIYIKLFTNDASIHERQANQVASDLAKNLGWKHEETLEKLQKVPASVLFSNY